MPAGLPTKDEVPVINLAEAPGERQAWGRPAWMVYLWGLVEAFLVTNPLQISSRLRVSVLRLFGAKIGADVVFRPRTRVKLPWKLSIGDRCWIGEGVWIHNQAEVTLGADVVLSQDAFITTGSHAMARDMALITKPITIEDGAWLTARTVLLGGTTVGRSAVIAPNTVVGPNALIGPEEVIGTAPAVIMRKRFSK